MTGEIDIRRGDVYYVYKSECSGSEQEGGRPAVVVSNNIGNAHAPVVSVVYMTTQVKNDLPTHVKIDINGKESTVLCEQVSTISKNKIGRFITSCTDEEMDAINESLACALGLDLCDDEREKDIESLEKMVASLKEKAESMKQRLSAIAESEALIERLKENNKSLTDELTAAKELERKYFYDQTSFYEKFYNDLFCSDKKIKIEVG